MQLSRRRFLKGTPLAAIALAGCGGSGPSGNESNPQQTAPGSGQGSQTDVVLHNKQDMKTKVVLTYSGDSPDATLEIKAGGSKEYDIPELDHPVDDFVVKELSMGDIQYTRRSKEYSGTFSSTSEDPSLSVELTKEAIVFSYPTTTS
ncbi:MAG: twin-arginine translocation signal domain-containing protein [Halobacteriaceae archaeon]